LKYFKEQSYELFGITRQAYHQRQNAMIAAFLHDELICGAVRDIRKSQPRVGGRKLQHMLGELGFAVGRDKLFAILRTNNLLVRPQRQYRKTTNSFHRFRRHPNLIKDLQVNRPNQVHVCDITYVATLEGFCYLALITDLYSRKIVGWDLSESLAIEGCQRALRMALRGVKDPQDLIHHSDRGIQYCSDDYVDILKQHGVRISMTEENHVYENAIAERVNGILKTEFLLGQTLQSFEVARKLVRQAIKIYNEQRLHTSLDYQTPESRYAA